MFCAEWRVAPAIGSAENTRSRIARRPLQHLHAAHRAAGDREQRVDAEMVEQHRLRAHHVADGDDREIEAPGLAGRRIGRGRPGGAHAGADHVRADDEIALGVDRPAGADHGLPPARLAGDRMDVGDVLVAGQRVADQHRVAALGIERAVGLVGDLERRRDRRRRRACSGLSAPKRTTSECGSSASRARSAGSSATLDIGLDHLLNPARRTRHVNRRRSAELSASLAGRTGLDRPLPPICQCFLCFRAGRTPINAAPSIDQTRRPRRCRIGHDKAVPFRPAVARRSAPRDRPHRRGHARPADGARRDHRPPDRGQADAGNRLGVPARRARPR